MTQGVIVQAPAFLVAHRIVINYIHGGPVDDRHSSKRQIRKLIHTTSIRERVNFVQLNFLKGSVRPIGDIITFLPVYANQVL